MIRKLVGIAMAFVAVPLFLLPASKAQQAGAPGVTAPLTERIAAARSVKIITSILGIKLNSELDAAHRKLDRLCAPGVPPKEEGRTEGEKEADDTKRSEQRTAESGEDNDEGHKVLWQLAGTDYSAVYITADDKERIDSITAVLRPDKQMPFDAIGDISKAPIKSGNSVVWDVLRPGQALFRVVARGVDGKASTIQIVMAQRKSNTLPQSAAKQAEHR